MKFSWYSKYVLKILNRKLYPVLSTKQGNVIFIHINKTAGTSILDAINKSKLHLTAKELESLLGKHIIKSSYVFTIVRNPFERVNSMFHHRVKTNKGDIGSFDIGFNDWVEACFSDNKDMRFYNRHYKMFYSQSDWLKSSSNEIVANKIIKMEDIDREWEELAKKFGFKSPLQKLNVSGKSRNWQGEYSDRSVELVIQSHYEDFTRFSYDMNLV